MKNKGIYIYGIIPNIHSPDMFRSLEKTGVYAIPFQNISAIVSERESIQLDQLDREHLGYLLVHHQKTIEFLMGLGFSMLLPMKLGTIVDSKEEVVKILANGYDLIMSTILKIENLIEIDVVVTWDNFPGLLKEISEHPDILAVKDEVMINNSTLSQIDKVKVGMLVQEKLKEKNTKTELDILNAITPFNIDVKLHEVMNDEMVTNSACLINKNKLDKFEQIIDQLDKEYKGALNFKLVGPLPCYSFYTIELKELDLNQVIQAKNVLELGEETSESEIKKAYLNKAKTLHPDTNLEKADEQNFNISNKAYHTLLDYCSAARQASKEDLISLSNEKMNENLFLVKIKE